MRFEFDLVLDDCLAQMRAGKTLDECLRAHPAQAQQLRPLLQAASQVWENPIPRARPAAVQTGLNRLLASANFQEVSLVPVSSGRFARYLSHVVGTLKIILFGKTHSRLNLAFRLGAALVLVGFASSAVMLRASASSLPGDGLYGVKRTWENVTLSLTPDEQSKQHLLEQFAGERREEVKELIQLRRAGTVEFQAPLEQMDAKNWQVDGFKVQIDPETEVEGSPVTGDAVDIRARLDADGTLYAIQVHVPAETKPSPSPVTSPIPGLTPQSDGDTEPQALETHQNPHMPRSTPQSTQGNHDQEDQESIHPAQPSEQAAAHESQFHPGHTPEPTQQPEIEHKSEPTEIPAAAHLAKPTEQPKAEPISEPTEKPE
jgi:hypothetical protein